MSGPKIKLLLLTAALLYCTCSLAAAADKYSQATSGAYYPSQAATNYNKQQQNQYRPAGVEKCARQSITLARQMLAHELAHINQYNAIWFSDLDKLELLEGQKHSLSNIVMSGVGTTLLNSNGQPLIEIESSYFRPAPAGGSSASPIAIRLLRRHADRCYLNTEKRQFTYVLGLSIGPLAHHLDLVYNLPKDLSLSQPLGWRYARVGLHIPRMNYEITLRQVADYNHLLGAAAASLRQTSAASSCPLEIADVTYLPTTSMAAIESDGLAVNNQTLVQIERLFDDYTRPTVSHRLRALLKFYLNCKTLPLSSASDY